MTSPCPTAERAASDPLLYAIFDCVPAVDDRPIWEWAAEHITVGEEMSHPGPFDIDLHPYAKEPLEILRNRAGVEVTIQASVQSVKSLIAQVFLAWMIKHRPGPAQWNAQTDDRAKDFAEFRLMPMLERCAPLKYYFPANRHKKRATTILFNHMFLVVQGAATPSNLQSLSVAIQVNDEVWLYPRGHLEQLRKRTTSFRSSRVILNLSTGAEDGDEADLAWEDSDQRELEVRCPSCGGWFDFQWDMDPNRPGGIIWEDSERTRNKDGTWKWRELRKTVAYECPRCGIRMPYSKQLQKDLLRQWRFTARNPDAPEDRIGFRWNAMAHMDWRDLVEEWHKAVAAYRRGDASLLKEFRMKRLAQTWGEESEDFRVEIRRGGYLMGQEWAEEGGIDSKGKVLAPPFPEGAPIIRLRFLTVDVQMDHFYVAVSSWSAGGSTRLLWCERVGTWEDIEAVQARFGIHAGLVFVDAGYSTFEVYRQCAARGWIALLGDNRPTFAHKKRGGGSIERFYSSRRKIVLGRGISCSAFRFSNLSVKDCFARLRSNQDAELGPTWEIPSDVPEEFLEHMESEHRVKERGKPIWKQIGDRPNHYLDACIQSVCAALMLKLIGREAMSMAEQSAQDSTEPDVGTINTASKAERR